MRIWSCCRRRKPPQNWSRFATSNYLAADQVPALVLPQHPSGVMTLASAHPIYCCPLREREPILRLPKSALVTVYPLPDARLLMVVNIHAVNFSLGVDVYSKQLLPIGDQIAHHSGPVIMAGDFNAWSWPRMNALYRFAREMSLREVRFSDDQRRRAFGRPLDFGVLPWVKRARCFRAGDPRLRPQPATSRIQSRQA
ncbi:endonuclease/exonuclease/phosphatase [Klebsiella pneumoniae subsp. rhinoscleromatis]|nr:endonuclease/exonuclease/phosphatase [Klebsiella pneumoniae subsp. rhinoscleromatis]